MTRIAAVLNNVDIRHGNPKRFLLSILADRFTGNADSIHTIDTPIGTMGYVGGPWGGAASFDGCSIVYDGTVRNPKNLAAAYGIAPNAQIALLLIHAWKRHGDDFAAHIDADIAFILVDHKSGRVVLGRDPIGVRPLAWGFTGGTLVAASSPGDIVASGIMPLSLDEAHIADYLVSLYEEPTATFHSNIHRVAPGTTLSVIDGGVVVSRYYTIGTAEIELPQDESGMIDRFSELFTRGVSRSIEGEERVGSTLSGGLDSSSVACTARQLLDRSADRLTTFSVIFDNVEASDEREYIDQVVQGGGLRAEYIRGDKISPLADLDRMLAWQGEPWFAPNLFLHSAMMQHAGSLGIRLLLDGLDGDTVVSHGMARLGELLRRGRLLELRRELQGVASGIAATTTGRLFWMSLVRPIVLGRPRRTWQKYRGRLDEPWRHDSAINPEFARSHSLAERYLDLFDARTRPLATHRQDHLRRLSWPLHGYILEVLDRLGQMHGVAPAYPFFDTALIDYCVALPAETRLRDGTTRWILREAMRGVLPEAIRQRPGKSNLGHNFERSFLRFESLRIDDLLADTSGPAAQFLDLRRLREITARYRMGGATSGEVMALWKGVLLREWLLRRFNG